MKNLLVLAVTCLLNVATCLAWTKSGKLYTTNGSQIDVQSAIDNASAGDTVSIPPGTFTWGAGGTSIDVHKAITLQGAGRGATTINLSETGPSGPSSVISLTAADSVVKSLTINEGGTGGTAFGCSQANDWRISDIEYLSSSAAYFCFISGVYGLIDNCNITGGAGNTELIFARGPADSWQTNNTLGTRNAVYIEDCTFNGKGTVCDFNSNSRGVVRFCTITGSLKIDGHGKASNTPPRGVRQMEVYGNEWTDYGYFASIELRGGTGRVFDNVSVAQSWLLLVEYGALNTWPNFGRVQTPADYPVDDQIGVGKDPKAGGSEPMYLWNNSQGGKPWPLTWKSTGADFGLQDLIAPDRDYFNEVASFNGSSGVGIGTRAQMNALSPSKKGVGFWVTDEGEWNSTHNGPDGRLYVWNGSGWALNYTPYAYPHPLSTGAAPPPSAPPASPSPSPSPTQNGLVAAYSFDETSGSTVADASGNGNTGTKSNTSPTTQGKYGGALSFNGTNSAVVVNHSQSLALSTAMTLEAWIFPTATVANWRSVLHKDTNSWYLYASGSSIPLTPAAGGTFGGSEQWISAPSAIPLNTWTHLATTYDGSTLRLYINGTEVAKKVLSGSILASSKPLRIGCTDPSDAFQGIIDEVRIYNKALTQTEIKSDMAAPVGGNGPAPSPSQSGLAAAYTFEETSGSSTADTSGNSNTGTKSNTSYTTQGKYGGALSFNGTNSAVVVNHSQSLAFSTAMTLEAWVFPTATMVNWHSVLLKETNSWYLYVSGPYSPMAPAAGGTFGGIEQWISAPSAIPLNKWTHLATTYNGSTLRLYINGTEVAKKALSGSIQVSSEPFRIGGTGPGDTFQGIIDEVRIYNRALTRPEVQADMNAKVGGSSSLSAPSNLRTVSP